MTNPLIQIDDLVREMTDAEYEHYLLITADPAPTHSQETQVKETLEP